MNKNKLSVTDVNTVKFLCKHAATLEQLADRLKLICNETLVPLIKEKGMAQALCLVNNNTLAPLLNTLDIIRGEFDFNLMDKPVAKMRGKTAQRKTPLNGMVE